MLQSLCPQMSTRRVFYPEPCYPEDTWTQCFGLQTVRIQPSHLFPLLACLSSCSTFETVSERATWLQTFMLMSLQSDSKEECYDFVAKRVYILVTWIILHCCFKLSDRNRFLKIAWVKWKQERENVNNIRVLQKVPGKLQLKLNIYWCKFFLKSLNSGFFFYKAHFLLWTFWIPLVFLLIGEA